MNIHQTIAATLEQVSKFTQGFEALLRDQRVKDHTLITLAVQELCVNIVEHAYAGQAGEIEIDIDLVPGLLRMVFRDHAPNAYTPPQEITMPDPLDLPEGGWGIGLIYQLVDQVDYQPQRGGNQWTLVKKLE